MLSGTSYGNRLGNRYSNRYRYDIVTITDMVTVKDTDIVTVTGTVTDTDIVTVTDMVTDTVTGCSTVVTYKVMDVAMWMNIEGSWR